MKRIDMKISPFLIFFLIYSCAAIAQDKGAINQKDEPANINDYPPDNWHHKIDTNKVYTGTDVQAHFGNNPGDWPRYVSKNFVFPALNLSDNRKYAAIVQFVVEKEGSLTNIKVLQSFNDECKQAAINLIQGSPKWHPGTISGDAVRSFYVTGILLPLKYPAENDIMLPIPNIGGTRWSNPAYSNKISFPQDSNQIYISPEVMPKFRNRADDWKTYISEHIKIPDSVKADGIAGKVIVQFVVERNGDVTFIKVLRTPNEECAQEATRLVKESGKWHPGMDKGIVVRSYYTVVILFGQGEK